MTNDCELRRKLFPALSRLKQGFDSPRERQVWRHSTTLYDTAAQPQRYLGR